MPGWRQTSRASAAKPSKRHGQGRLERANALTVFHFLEVPGLHKVRLDVLKPPEQLGDEDHDVGLEKERARDLTERPDKAAQGPIDRLPLPAPSVLGNPQASPRGTFPPATLPGSPGAQPPKENAAALGLRPLGQAYLENQRRVQHVLQREVKAFVQVFVGEFPEEVDVVDAVRDRRDLFQADL